MGGKQLLIKKGNHWQDITHIQEWDNHYEEKMDKDEDLTNTSADSTTHSGYHH